MLSPVPTAKGKLGHTKECADGEKRGSREPCHWTSPLSSGRMNCGPWTLQLKLCLAPLSLYPFSILFVPLASFFTAVNWPGFTDFCEDWPSLPSWRSGSPSIMYTEASAGGCLNSLVREEPFCWHVKLHFHPNFTRLMIGFCRRNTWEVLQGKGGSGDLKSVRIMCLLVQINLTWDLPLFEKLQTEKTQQIVTPQWGVYCQMDAPHQALQETNVSKREK